MELNYTAEGKAYMSITEEEARNLPQGTPILYVGGAQKAIAPPDCKHELELSDGFPRKILGCKKCVYWKFA